MKRKIITIRLKFLILLFLMPGVNITAQELRDYLEIAAKNNPGLQGAYAEYEASLQESPQVKSLPDPTLTMSALGRMEDARFSLMQMFPWFGTLSAREEAANFLAEARFQGYLDKRNELYFQVSEQYYQLFNLDQNLRFQSENLKILEEYRDLALARVRAGDGTLADVLQVDLLRNEAKTLMEVLEMERKPLLASFNSLLNRDKGTEVPVPEDLTVGDTRFIDLEGNLTEHPRLLEMQKRRQAAESDEVAAKKTGMPTVGIGVTMVINQRMAMDSPESRENVVMPMLSVSLPIFRKKYVAAQKEAQFMQESYSLQQKEVENNLQAEYEGTVYEAKKMREMVLLYERQVESADQVLELLLSSYRNAEVGFEEVLRVRQELLRYQLKTAEAKSAYFTQLARIEYLTAKSYAND